MKNYFIVLLTTFFVSSMLFAQETFKCGTKDMDVESAMQSLDDFEQWRSNRTRDTYPIQILVAWHCIYSTSNTGYLSQNHIENSIEAMNQEYNQHEIFFVLDTINYVQNDDWFYNIDEAASNHPVEQEMRQATYIDPYHYYNIWTVDLNGTGAGGWNQFGSWNAEGSYWQGATVHYSQSGGGMTNHTIIHEAGHHFELSHTFQYGCNAPGDVVDDTPYQDDDGTYSCSPSTDTCPNDPGTDPVRNHMNYSNCRDEFSPGQVDRIFWSIENYHPGYLENNFNYPTLSVSSLSYLQDTDGDNQFNPGDTTKVKVIISNDWGGDALNVEMTLSTDDPRINIIDGTISFVNTIMGDIVVEPGELASNLFDWFIISADADAVPGNVPCTVTITAGTEEFPYQVEETVSIELTLSQAGFPITSLNINSSPVVYDVDSDGKKEIFFGTDDNLFYGFNSYGEQLNGFPFSTNGRIRSSPAIGDVDNDGEVEIVFGNSGGKLYILNHNGSQQLAYTQLGFIEGAPVLSDIDNDGDLEIIFGTTTGSGGQIYVIHHNGVTVAGFPKEVGQMIAGPAVHDIDSDGVVDIVCSTYDKKVWVLEANSGNVKQGFPFSSEGRFSTPPTIVDIDNDGHYEIAAGSNNGDLYILNKDASLYAQYYSSDDIRGGVSVCDLNNDGQLDLLFGGYTDSIHVWDPVNNQSLPGWPVDLGYNILSEPLLADLDGDGQNEVLAARKNGKIFAYESDGSLMGNFPISTGGLIETTPAIEDIDNDGDLEIVIGTTAGLQVIDIKLGSELMDTWHLYRATTFRTGVYDEAVMSVDKVDHIVPDRFYVSANYPNPFNPSTNFFIDVPSAGRLNISIYDVNGKLVNEVINTYVEAGRIYGSWSGKNISGKNMPTGIYFMKVKTSLNFHVQKLALVK